VLLGLVAVSAGVAWGTGGTAALRKGIEALTEVLPFLLIGIGSIILLRAVLPRGQAVVGPALLIAVGVVWIGTSYGLVDLAAVRPLGSAVLIAGGAVVAMSRRSSELDIDTGVRSCTALIFPRSPRFAGTPRKYVIRALAGDVILDLSRTPLPPEDEIVFDLFLLYGYVRLTLPKDWVVVHGRLETARRIRLDGTLDEPYKYVPPEPSDDGDDEDEEMPEWHGGRGGAILNISGFGGTLVLVRSG